MKRRKQRGRGAGTLYKRKPSGPWIARWFDHTGRRRERSTQTTDRTAAERILAKHLANVALRRDGVIDARADRHSQNNAIPLASHLEDWRASLTAKGVTPKQVTLVSRRARAVVKRTGAERLPELTASAVQAGIGALRDDGRSLQTCQHYLRAIKQFTRWLKRDGRICDDALAHLTGFNTATDRKYRRRALDAEELRWLIETTASASTWRGLTGSDRAMLYRVAAGTGFRAAELHSLTRTSFRLAGDRPVVELHAGSSKRRRHDVQPIRADLAALLSRWLADRPADAPCWPGTWREKAAQMIQRDLRHARAKWIKETPGRAERRRCRESDSLAILDGDGRVLDFHSLRVSYITALVIGGASVKVAQELARHSDPKLTLNVYTTLGIHDSAAALDALPDLDSKPRPAEPLRAVGTLHHTADVAVGGRLYPRQLERETAQPGAAGRTVASAGKGLSGARKPSRITALRDSAQPGATSRKSSAAVAQLAEQRFCKPQVVGSSPTGGFGVKIFGQRISCRGTRLAEVRHMPPAHGPATAGRLVWDRN